MPNAHVLDGVLLFDFCEQRTTFQPEPSSSGRLSCYFLQLSFSNIAGSNLDGMFSQMGCSVQECRFTGDTLDMDENDNAGQACIFKVMAGCGRH